MSKQSTLIGTVVDGTPKLNRTVHNERFYSIEVEILGATIPVLISEYILKEQYSETVQIKGCLMSDYKKGVLPKFYIYANDITNVDADTPLTNEVQFSGKVTKNKGFTTNTRCRSILPLTLSDRSPIGGISVLYVCIRDKAARELKDRDIGYTIQGTGYLKKYRDVYEILVTDFEVE